MRGLRYTHYYILCVLLYSVAVQCFGTCSPGDVTACPVNAECVGDECKCKDGFNEGVDNWDKETFCYNKTLIETVPSETESKRNSNAESYDSTGGPPASTTQSSPTTTENITTKNTTTKNITTEETKTKEKPFGSNFQLIGGSAFAAALKDGGAFAAAFGKQ